MPRPSANGAEPAPAVPVAPDRRTVLGGTNGARRRWAFRLAAALLVPGLVLVVGEGILRLAGWGYDPSFFVRHPAAGPDHLVENRRFSWRFFPQPLARYPDPLVLARDKPPGVCRIFVFGESAAEGDPAPAFGFSRILEVLLRARYPQGRFEVVNVAFTAISSPVILPIAREAARLGGDYWLVYMGHNEVIGPFGAGTVFGGQSPPLPLLRATLALKATRLGQALDALRQTLTPVPAASGGWRGMSMFLAHQVRAQDPRLDRVRHRFQRNLEDLLRLGSSRGARVIVSTPVSRVRDWPPFASLHRPDLPAATREEWTRHYEAGAAAEAEDDLPAALQHYQQAAALDDTHAELQYRLGRTRLALGQTEDAQRHLTLARDLDTLRFRTDSRLHQIIRATATAAGPRVHLLDTERAFAEASPNGLPGEEWLYEHVHFHFAGNYLLARLFADALAEHLPAPTAPTAPTEPGSDPWLSEAACAARLAYGDSQRHDILRVLELRFAEDIYRGQLGHTQRVARLEAEIARLRAGAKSAGRRLGLELCRQALTASPDDWILHELAARLLDVLGDRDGARAAWQQVARRIPHHPRPYTELAMLEERNGQTAAALAAFQQALTVHPDFAEALEGIGLLYAQQGRTADAERALRRALRLDPTRRAAAEALAGRTTRSSAPRPRRRPAASRRPSTPDPTAPRPSCLHPHGEEVFSTPALACRG